MSDLSSLSDKQLIERHRYLTDRVVDIKKKLDPLFAEYDKIRDEYMTIDQELARRNGLPTLQPEADKQD